MADKKTVEFRKLKPGNKFICPDAFELSGEDRVYVKLKFLVYSCFSSDTCNAVDLCYGIPVEIGEEEKVITVNF